MKKFMLAVVALVAVSSLSLVSCGGGNPADKAAALIKETTEAIKKNQDNPEKVAEIQQKAAEELQKIAESCKTDEEKMAVAAAIAKAAQEVDY